ncbi:hypothetical protein Pan216_15140 [Planctomycetes bacterium Pan216]|uniref:Uncharacterized protein n=1 Tax=Kolteria novifilia TaxID=2527975 RepID=A0A518B111_9BACT|nr:hypothetical protein Pan216_15140 [Planctomycetes bacterium Pan216]
MSSYGYNLSPTLGATGGLTVAAIPLKSFMGLDYATELVAEDVTALGPGVWIEGDPTNTILGLGQVFVGMPSTMGNSPIENGSAESFG